MAAGAGYYDVLALELEQRAQEITNVYNNYEQTMSQIRSVVHGLEGIWKGRSMETLVERFDSEQPSITELGQTIQNYATEARKAAEDSRNRNKKLYDLIVKLLRSFFS